MIAVELSSVVCDEPCDDRLRGGPVVEPVRLHAGTAYHGRIRYLPQLALVVIEHRAGYSLIVPVEHVHHMTTDAIGLDVVALLGEVV